MIVEKELQSPAADTPVAVGERQNPVAGMPVAEDHQGLGKNLASAEEDCCQTAVAAAVAVEQRM